MQGGVWVVRVGQCPGHTSQPGLPERTRRSGASGNQVGKKNSMIEPKNDNFPFEPVQHLKTSKSSSVSSVLNISSVHPV